MTGTYSTLDKNIFANTKQAPTKTKSDEPAVKEFIPRKLSVTEIEVVRVLVRTGGSPAELAEHLPMSPNTIRTHLCNVQQKLGLDNKLKIMVWALKNGIADPPK